MPRARTTVTEGLLIELAKEEALLTEVEAEFVNAKTKYNVATRKYAAVRDMLTDYMGFSPYLEISPEWPEEAKRIRPNKWGRFKFVHMKPGDAVVEVLCRAEEPISLEEIVERLRAGGIGTISILLTRQVNAALMKTNGIVKNEEGKYTYEGPQEEEIKPDELPF